MKITKVELDKIKEMFEDNYKYMIAPLDDMYELSIIPSCSFYTIENENETTGYYAINDEQEIMQYYIKDKYINEKLTIFNYILKNQNIEKALCCTYDSMLYPLCNDIATSKEVSDYLYCEGDDINVDIPKIVLDIEEPTMSDFDVLMSYYQSQGIEGDWLPPYLKERLELSEMLLYKNNNEIIATVECRISKTSKNIANIGMTTSDKYRKKGIATYVVNHIRKEANKKGFNVICSTSAENIGVQKSIERAGMKLYHTMYKIKI